VSKEPRAVFLEPGSYRRRRARDASRLLPFLGLFLLLLPALWPREAGGGIGMSQAMVFMFLVWAGLICLAAFLSRRLDDRDGGRAPGPDA